MRTTPQGSATRAILLIGLLFAASSSALASRMDALIIALGGNDEKARAEARQLLPRESIEAVPRLLPLVVQDNEEVWRSAFNVLSDFIGEVGVPGREDERQIVVGHLMTLIAPEQPAKIKLRGLRLLPAAVPAGYDISPMIALLDDPELRERARAALVELGTSDAAAALRDHLPKAEPSFQVALLDGLAQMRDEGSTVAIHKLTGSPDGHVRIAAIRALSWTGNPLLIQTARVQFEAADPDLKSEARDALVRTLRGVETHGGNWQILVETYLDLIETEDQLVKESALAGLGRVGDGTCVGPVLDAIKGIDNPTRAIGIAALGEMQGIDVARTIVEAWPSLDTSLQTALIAVLGTKKTNLVMPVLTQAASSDDGPTRLAALQAIAATELPEGIDVLVAAGKNGTAEEKAAAATGVVSLANALRDHDKAKEAGKAYAAALELAADDDAARAALAGLAACPVQGAFKAIMKAAEREELKPQVVPALTAIAGTLVAAGQKERALKAYEKVRDLGGGSDTMKIVAKGMKELGANVDFSSLLGIVTHWWVVGPFELGAENAGWNQALIGEPQADLNGRYMAGKRRLDWQQVTSQDDRGLVDLLKVLGPAEKAIGYAYTEIDVPQETQAVLRLGVDDSERIWVNGEMVFEHFVARGLVVDQDQVPVKLKAGKNVILMKIWQHTLGWEFCLRVTTPDGQPVSFSQKSAK